MSPGPLTSPARLLNVHGNAPGALAALNTLLARDGVNIVAQHLQTHGQMGYVVTDLDKVPSPALAAALDAETTFIRCRTILNPLA